MDLCPLAVDWGNVAEWAGVVVAGVVGFLVWRLTRAANRTQNEVAELHIGADERAGRQQEVERSMLLIELAQPVSMAYALATGVAAELDAFIEDGTIALRLTNSIESRQEWIARVAALQLPVRDYVIDRIHLIGNPLAARIVRARSWPMSLSSLLAVGRTTTGDRAVKDAKLVLAGLRMLCRELEVINEQCLAAMREAGLNIPPAESVTA
ncbi:hypothetical protein [Luteimonas rhizosphaerae]|nr:hypothetical protein [Luteimonas sp. 4-12]